VQHDGEQAFVYISAPNGPQRKPVVIGANDGESVEIKKGIRLGDEILLMPPETKNRPQSPDQ
jgi:hypothetical protein